MVTAPLNVAVPDAVIAATVVAPPTSSAPVTSTASAIVTLVESDESSVVPFTLKALIKTSPVPLGCKLRSAFEPFDVT